MWWAAAASIVLIAGIFAVLKLTESPRIIQVASHGNIVVDTLADGTRITLNKNSFLSSTETFNQHVRKVSFSGEVFFEVKHNAFQPFVVDAGIAKVMVLGTSFRLVTHPDGVGGSRQGGGSLEVNVVEGVVMLFRVDKPSGDTISLILKAGESGIFNADAPKPVRLTATSPDVLFWANRSLDFKNRALSEVFLLIEKYYQVRITAVDPSILDCRLTASFMNEPAGNILDIIAQSFGLTVDAHENHFQLSGHGCSKEAD